MKEGEIKCPKCEGGGSWPQKFLDITSPSWVRCPKCKGKGTLDWIENIMGVAGTYIKPGVYIHEVDFSDYITEPGVFRRNSEDDPWIFEREFIGEDNGE